MAASTSSGSSMPLWSLRRVWKDTPPRAETPPASLRKVWDLSPRMISSPR